MPELLHVEIIGTGPPLVLLHGWGWHSGIWRPILPELSQCFQLFLIDLPGFGKSTVFPIDYTIEAVSQLIFDVVPSQAAWLGWSLGGMIAWWIAIKHPQKVNKLVTVASTPKFIAEDKWPGVAPATLERFGQALLTDPNKTLQEFIELQLRGSTLSHIGENQDLLGTPLLRRDEVNRSSFSESLELLKTLDLRNDLSKVKCPSLHIFGSHDTLVPKSLVTTLQPQLPATSRCEIFHRTGHIPFLTHPELFLNQLLL